VATDTNAVLDMDVKSILEEFTDLPDPRSHINRLHLLGDLVVICIMAVSAHHSHRVRGADGVAWKLVRPLGQCVGVLA